MMSNSRTLETNKVLKSLAPNMIGIMLALSVKSVPKTVARFSVALASLVGITSSAGEVPRQASVLDLFPASGLPSGKGEVSCTFDYVPSGSTWNPKVDEKSVFLASFIGEGWKLGVGKGGHI